MSRGPGCPTLYARRPRRATSFRRVGRMSDVSSTPEEDEKVSLPTDATPGRREMWARGLRSES